MNNVAYNSENATLHLQKAEQNVIEENPQTSLIKITNRLNLTHHQTYTSKEMNPVFTREAKTSKRAFERTN